MNNRALFQISMTLLVAIASAACSADESEGDSAASCASVCAKQNELCGDSSDCAALCSSLAKVNATTGCGAEYQAGLECLATANKCDQDETICPGASFLDCIAAYCAGHPSEPFC